MLIFRYEARDKSNNVLTGEVEAETRIIAEEILGERGLKVVSLEEKQEIKFLASLLRFFGGVGAREITIFARQLSVMISAKVPVVQAIKIISGQIENKNFKVIISEISREVEGGARLSVALARYPHIFSDFFVNIIKSGETSGKLDEVLTYLADQTEKDYDLNSKIKGAMIYPAFILSGLLVVGIVMMVFVVPKLTDVLKETGQQLPLSTRMLIGTSAFLSGYWWLLAIIIIGLVVGFQFYRKTPQGRENIDLLKLKTPIMGELFKRIYLVRFTRSLTTLLTGGVSIVNSLKIVSEVVGNTVYKNLIIETAKEVEGGNPIAKVFLESKKMPPMVAQMMDIGEKTGKLTFVLEKLSEFYSREVDNQVRNLATLIEPLVMVLIGVGVGIMVAAIILPMYNMASSF